MLYLNKEKKEITKNITEIPVTIYVLKEVCKKSFLMNLTKKYIEEKNLEKFKILVERRDFLETNWQIVLQEHWRDPQLEEFLLNNITEDNLYLCEGDKGPYC